VTESIAAAPPREGARFHKLLFGQTVSQLGTAVSVVVLPMVAVLQLHATPLEVGIITSAEYIAYSVLGLVAGVYVDRWPRRTVMLITDAGRAILLALVPVLWALGVLQIWQLFLVALGVGVLSLFFDLSYQAYLPSIVSRELLLQRNSQLQASTSVTQLAGPGVAGLLVQAIGAAFSLVTDALSYVVSFVTVMWIGGPSGRVVQPREAGARRESVRRQIADGFRYIRDDQILLSGLVTIGQFNFLITAEQALVILFLLHDVHAPPSLVGVLMATSGVGAIVGAVSARRLSQRFGSARAYAVGAALGPLLGVMIPFAYLDARLLFFIAGTAGLGATTTILKTVGQSFRQAKVPSNMLGRVIATNRVLTWAPVPLGGLLGGLLGQWIGVRSALLVLALLLATAPLWLLMTPVLRIRNLEDAR
jgi:MFS family permease